MKTCPRCGSIATDNAQFCSNCGYSYGSASQAPGQNSWRQNTPPPPYAGQDNCFDVCGPEGKSRGVTALLAILLGCIGAQYFYLGKVTAGILSIVISLVTCGLWEFVTVIQGIYMFTLTNDQFRAKYVATPSQFPIF